MIEFQENAWTEGQTEGWRDGRMEGRKDRSTDRPYFTGPFRLPPGVQKSLLLSKIEFPKALLAGFLMNLRCCFIKI